MSEKLCKTCGQPTRPAEAFRCNKRFCGEQCRIAAERQRAALLDAFFEREIPAEVIAQRSAEVRRGWSPCQERQRRGAAADEPYRVPIVKVADCGLAFRAED